ncbi:MAG TPA: translation elongation factor Ts [Steroidobacteraceae bacterium]|nr:translation elongation factor Ts [Steroidobacteraceae bacterium]
MTITAEAVKQLRERTGAGMMECKKALVEAGGDLDAAAELMRKQGLAKADKKATRLAAEGTIVAARSADGRTAALAEINCETDFVAREQDFRAFAATVGELALANRTLEVATLLALKTSSGDTLEERRRALIAKIGENITVRRVAVVSAPTTVGAYIHHSNRVGTLIALKGGDEALARDVAMHVAAINPEFISPGEVPADLIAKEREIFAEQVKAEGKPPEIAAKMLEGKLRKRLNEISLLGQPFVKDDKMTVEGLLKKAGAEVTSMVRFEVGAGLEKKQGDFAAEVMATVQGAAAARH